jgi:hypothetical protein
MKQSEIIEMLKDFLSGKMLRGELSEKIDNRLFDLRQKPNLTSEQELLSNLELYIHEVMEGYRSWDELYEYMVSIIEHNMSEHFVKTITLNTSATSKFQTVTRAIPVKDYRRDLSLV